MRSSADKRDGNAGGKIVLPSMMPVLPYEVPSPGPAAIDQRDREPALGEMQGDRGADDAGSKHDGIDARHGDLLRRRYSADRGKSSRGRLRKSMRRAVAQIREAQRFLARCPLASGVLREH